MFDAATRRYRRCQKSDRIAPKCKYLSYFQVVGPRSNSPAAVFGLSALANVVRFCATNATGVARGCTDLPMVYRYVHRHCLVCP